jgi:hypothetical protein
MLLSSRATANNENNALLLAGNSGRLISPQSESEGFQRAPIRARNILR